MWMDSSADLRYTGVMTINYFEMFASLRMGLDIVPETEWEDVPHCRKVGYTPTYTTRMYNTSTEAWEAVPEASTDLAVMVDEAHWRWTLPVGVYEDEYPIFYAG